MTTLFLAALSFFAYAFRKRYGRAVVPPPLFDPDDYADRLEQVTRDSLTGCDGLAYVWEMARTASRPKFGMFPDKLYLFMRGSKFMTN